MSGERSTTATKTGHHAARPEEGVLELEVADFGPIVRAQVELRPFTVFVGPSNTGKSVLAILCYALHRFFSDHGRMRYGSWADGRTPNDTSEETARRDEETARRDADLAEARSWLEEMLSDRWLERPNPDAVQLPEAAVRLVRAALGGPADHGKRLDDEIARCFGVKRSGGLARHGTRQGAVTLRYRPAPGLDSACIEHHSRCKGVDRAD